MFKQNLHIKLMIAFFTISIYSSCGIFRKKPKAPDVIIEDKTSSELNNFVKKAESNNLQFNTFYSIFSGNFQLQEKSFPLKGLLKIKKDTFIQISIRPTMGIEMAKILFTKDSIKYIDRFKKQFLKDDYLFLQKKFGIELNYQMLQSLLTNKFFVYPAENDLLAYKLKYPKKTDSSYFLNYRGDNFGKNIIHKLKFAQNTLNLLQNNLFIIEKKQNVNILYSEFYKLNNSKFPKNIKIKLNENQIKYKINIIYKNIKLNKSLNSNFTVPKNYKPLNFE